MDDNSNNKSTSYEVVDFSTNEVKKQKNGYVKGVIVPFFSGIVGASLVIGTCFGVPNIRAKILGENTNSVTASTPNAESNQVQGTLSQVSLSNYSDTGISVAQKVRPSIVGIAVEYSINSIFYKSGTSTAERFWNNNERRWIYFNK